MRQHGHLDRRGRHSMKGSEARGWYRGQHAEICLAALYVGLKIVSAVGLVCIV